MKNTENINQLTPTSTVGNQHHDPTPEIFKPGSLVKVTVKITPPRIFYKRYGGRAATETHKALTHVATLMLRQSSFHKTLLAYVNTSEITLIFDDSLRINDDGTINRDFSSMLPAKGNRRRIEDSALAAFVSGLATTKIKGKSVATTELDFKVTATELEDEQELTRCLVEKIKENRNAVMSAPKTNPNHPYQPKTEKDIAYLTRYGSLLCNQEVVEINSRTRELTEKGFKFTIKKYQMVKDFQCVVANPNVVAELIQNIYEE